MTEAEKRAATRAESIARFQAHLARQQHYDLEVTIELLGPDDQAEYQQKHTDTIVHDPEDETLTQAVARYLREQVDGKDHDLVSDEDEDGTETTWTTSALWIEDSPTWRISVTATKQD